MAQESMMTVIDPLYGRIIYISNIVTDGSSSGGTTAAKIVSSITTRDLIPVQERGLVWVVDASIDPTVESGGALYEWNADTMAWIKLSEAESLEIAEKIIAALANYYTKAQIDARRLSAEFSSSDLSSGILSIAHTNGNVAFSGSILNHLGKVITPDDITYVNNGIIVDLSSYVSSMSGTWSYVFVCG